jgi:hypothetical protein
MKKMKKNRASTWCSKIIFEQKMPGKNGLLLGCDAQ